MFTTFIVQPLFNLLVTIYALIPGHNFGLALIIFTILIRLVMWPLVKKQIYHTKITRALQPELKRIKREAKGDRQKESMMMMALYKERGVNPFGVFPTLILQMVIIIGLYSGLTKVIKDPHQIINFAYAPLQHLGWMEHIARNIKDFDNSLLGLIDLARPALSSGGMYWPAFVLVAGSAGIQFLTSRQLIPRDKDSRKLREIFKSAGDGKQADQAEISAALSRNMQYIIPIMVFLFTINLAAALSLYWLTSGVVAYIQQARALNREEHDLQQTAETPADKKTPRDLGAIAEAELVPAAAVSSTRTKKSKNSKRPAGSKKRRR